MIRKRLGFTGLLILYLCLVTVAIIGASSGSTILGRSVIVSGGGTAAISEVRMNGTVGQAITGASAGTSTRIQAGYWNASSPSAPPFHILSLPIVLNDYVSD